MPAVDDTLIGAGTVSEITKWGDTSIQPPLGSRAQMSGKHSRETLATGRIDPCPAGDCGKCSLCVLNLGTATESCRAVDHFSKDVIATHLVGLEVLSSVLPAMRTILDKIHHPLEVGGKPVLSQREWHFQEWQSLLSEEMGRRPHCEGCPHRRVRVNCCQAVVRQHRCASHGRGPHCFAKTFTTDPLDPVDPSMSGLCWCHDNRIASRTLASWLDGIDSSDKGVGHELLAGSLLSHTKDVVSQGGALAACPALVTEGTLAAVGEPRSTNNTQPRFHPSHLHDGVTSDDLLLREVPFIKILQDFCTLPSEKIVAIYASPPLKSCSPDSRCSRTSLLSKKQKKARIVDTSGLGNAERYPTLTKRERRRVPTSTWDNWTVNDPIYRQWISDNSRVHGQIAFNIAEDLAYDVWKEWTETELRLLGSGTDSAPSTPRGKSRQAGLISPHDTPVVLGRTRFIIFKAC